MSYGVNPYHAGRPVEDPTMFFGRDDALAWVERQLALDRRLLVVYGPDLIGKTSLVHRLPGVLPEHVHCLYFECKPYQGESLSRVLTALAGELATQLMARHLVSPHQVDTATDPAAAVKSLLQQATLAPNGTQPSQGTNELLLVLDDVHRLMDDENLSLASFFGFLATLLAEAPSLRLLLTLSDLDYDRLTHPLLTGATAFRLGPLSSSDTQHLITQPPHGVLRFDAGVVKRIADINSNHPYYLHLFCYTLYNSCAREGWINQSDVDAVLQELLSLPNERFEAIWEQSNAAERAALAAMAALKGVHGPIMRQEVVNYLRGLDPEVAPQVILDALESLADRGVLVRMGALSYRFALNLLRYWLGRHISPAGVLASVAWDRPSARPSTPPASAEAVAGESRREEEEGKQRWGLGRLFILGLTGTALIGTAFLALAFTGVLPLGITDPTPTALPGYMPGDFASPTPTATPTPAPTPTPTRPLVVARTLPAIVYMARGVAGSSGPSTWQIFIMDADGTNRQQLAGSDADDITPVWSPNGRRVAFVSQRDGNREIYVINSDGTGLVNITQHPAEDWAPAWSPDGSQIAFSSNRQGNWEIFIVNADTLTGTGGSDLRQITNDGTGSLSPVWSPDGQTMAYSNKRDGYWEIYTMPAPDAQPVPAGESGGAVTSTHRRLTFSAGNDLSPLFSPQGDLIAFESNREGNVEIYVANADGSNQRNISNLPYADDHGPAWSPDGRRLVFYSNREGNWDLFMMTAAGEDVVNLTNTPDLDEQAPAWRP